jgi:GxxExxY protein
MENFDYKHKELTEQIIGVFYDVYNELGFGFLEKVYQNAMYFELLENGFDVKPQKQIKVHFKGRQVGEYFADLVINDLVILELKATESLLEEHEIQLINYLKATDIEVGLLLNFGRKPKCIRKAFDNERKKHLKKISFN